MKRQMDKGLLGLGFANDELLIIEAFFKSTQLLMIKTMVGSLVDSKCTIYFGVVFLLTLSSLSESSFNFFPRKGLVCMEIYYKSSMFY
jgi:hypothetical protein